LGFDIVWDLALVAAGLVPAPTFLTGKRAVTPDCPGSPPGLENDHFAKSIRDRSSTTAMVL